MNVEDVKMLMCCKFVSCLSSGPGGIGKSALGEGIAQKLNTQGRLPAGFAKVDMFSAHTKDDVYTVLNSGLDIGVEVGDLGCSNLKPLSMHSFSVSVRACTRPPILSACMQIRQSHVPVANTQEEDQKTKSKQAIAKELQKRAGKNGNLLLFLDSCEMPLQSKDAADALAEILLHVSAELHLALRLVNRVNRVIAT